MNVIRRKQNETYKTSCASSMIRTFHYE